MKAESIENIKVPEFDVKKVIKSLTDQIGHESIDRYKEILTCLSKTWEFVNYYHIESLKTQQFLIIEQCEKLAEYEQFFKENPEIKKLKEKIDREKI